MRATPILHWSTALELRNNQGQLCNYSLQTHGPDGYLPYKLFSEKEVTRYSELFQKAIM